MDDYNDDSYDDGFDGGDETEDVEETESEEVTEETDAVSETEITEVHETDEAVKVNETEKSDEIKETKSDEVKETKTDEVKETKNGEKDSVTGTEETELHDLSESDREAFSKETGWSEEVLNSIKTKEEADIYKNCDLKEEKIEGKTCLIRNDLDMEQKDEFGRTNRERMENGNAPISRDGETVELHHIGQKPDSPLAELKTSEHRGKGVDSILHDKTKETEIDRNEFAKERSSHWKKRA